MNGWKHEFGDRLKTHRGESGVVIARSEAQDKSGVIRQSYKLLHEDSVWDQRFEFWAPAHALIKEQR